MYRAVRFSHPVKGTLVRTINVNLGSGRNSLTTKLTYRWAGRMRKSNEMTLRRIG